MNHRSHTRDRIQKLPFGKYFAIALFAFVFTSLAFAQANSGDVTGTIVDASGASIQGASVTATNEATNIKTVVEANAEGTYHFTNLPVGSYTITGTAKGFTSTGLSTSPLT